MNPGLALSSLSTKHYQLLMRLYPWAWQLYRSIYSHSVAGWQTLQESAAPHLVKLDELNLYEVPAALPNSDLDAYDPKATPFTWNTAGYANKLLHWLPTRINREVLPTQHTACDCLEISLCVVWVTTNHPQAMGSSTHPKHFDIHGMWTKGLGGMDAHGPTAILEKCVL